MENPDKINKLSSNIVFLVCVSNPVFQDEIVKKLLLKGIPIEKILIWPSLHFFIAEDYFTNLLWSFGKGEVFVDCGCLDGKTSRMFINAVQSNSDIQASVSKIIAYEPDKKSLEVCKKNMADIPYFHVRNVGVWNKKEALHFSSFGNGGSSVTTLGNDVVNFVSLDEDLGDERVTFIKMDIEGAELNALRGAEKIIREQRPKLAVSLYHKPEDILVIPEFIINLDLNYKIYMRHQTAFCVETVLYAVP